MFDRKETRAFKNLSMKILATFCKESNMRKINLGIINPITYYSFSLMGWSTPRLWNCIHRSLANRLIGLILGLVFQFQKVWYICLNLIDFSSTKKYILLILKTEFKAKKLLPRNRGMQISSRLHSRRVLTVLFSFFLHFFYFWIV